MAPSRALPDVTLAEKAEAALRAIPESKVYIRLKAIIVPDILFEKSDCRSV